MSHACPEALSFALLTTLLLLFLMSSLLVGFSILLASNQKLAGSNNDQVHAFYAAEAGMEQLTANLGNLFSQTYSPSIGQVNNLMTTPPPPLVVMVWLTMTLVAASSVSRPLPVVVVFWPTVIAPPLVTVTVPVPLA